MKVVFEPKTADMNKYTSIITHSLNGKGINVFSLKEMFQSWNLFFKIKIIHLNWFEGISGTNFLETFGVFCKKFILLFILFTFNKKVVWTMHNKTPHNSKNMFYTKCITYLIVKFSKKIVIHSSISKDILLSEYNISENKIVYCPHPNYIGAYGDVIDSFDVSQDRPIKLLFMGQIRQYKGVEILLSAIEGLDLVGRKVNLTIAGTIKEEYKKKLELKIKDNSVVKLVPKFIKDEDIRFLLNECDVLVLPYNIISSLNSGTVLLSFSYKKAVICPLIGTVQDIVSHEKIFTYTYNTDLEHIDLLRDQIRIVASHTPKEIQVLGHKLYDYVKSENDIEKVSSILSSVYLQLN